MAKQTLNIGDTGQQLVDKFNGNFTELYDLHTISNELIKWTQGKNWEPVDITYDSELRVTSATVKWPDGSLGTYTATDYNATHEIYDGFTITHTDSGLTVTQPAVTRGTDGQVTHKPNLTVA